MSHYDYYRGYWPQKAKKKTSKYSIRRDDNEWKVTIFLQLDGGMKALVVEEAHQEIVDRVNDIKQIYSGQAGGSFYINEYGHLIVPDMSSNYYFGGKFNNVDFRFLFEDKIYSTRPFNSNGLQLNPGEVWYGPKPGIPYVLAAGGDDIRYDSVIFVNGEPTKGILPVSLVESTQNSRAAEENIRMVREIVGTVGGRFYVNEHHAVFVPPRGNPNDGVNFRYCGQLNMTGWFPEPSV